MKLQYLGDSRDSFKWHYHDYLMNHNPNAGSFGYYRGELGEACKAAGAELPRVAYEKLIKKHPD